MFQTPLKRILNPKGDVFHAMKKSDPGFAGFGEAYFTTVIAGETKGWKRHRIMTLNLVVPMGQVRIYVRDQDEGPTRMVDLGGDNYARLTIPPGAWVAFRGIGETTNLMLNLASIEHDPFESETATLDKFPLQD